MKIQTTRIPALIVLSLALACGKSEDDSDASSGVTTTAATPAGTDATTGAESGTVDPTTAPTTTTVDPTTGPDDTTSVSASEPTTDGTTGTPVTECTAYCDTIELNCAGDFTQYGSREMCEATCATFTPGVAGEMAGNTLACRTYHAGAAAMADDVHCGHAGPGGDAACGSNCEGFCGIAAVACPDAWPDITACATACNTFDPAEKYDAKDVSGNTFACRLYHLTAATVDPATHCAHIKGDSPTCI